MHPSEDKYRQIKGTNAKIKATLFAINGASNLLTIMNFTEIEPQVYVFLESEIHLVIKFAHLIDEFLIPIRMEFMSEDERKKQVLLLQRRNEIAERQRLEKEHAERLKK